MSQFKKTKYVQTSRTSTQLYLPKFVPTIVANKSMNKGFKLNTLVMKKKTKEHSNDLFIMPMDEQ